MFLTQFEVKRLQHSLCFQTHSIDKGKSSDESVSASCWLAIDQSAARTWVWCAVCSMQCICEVSTVVVVQTRSHLLETFAAARTMEPDLSIRSESKAPHPARG